MVILKSFNVVRSCRRSLLHLAMLTSIVATAAAFSHFNDDSMPDNIGTIVDKNRPGIPFCNESPEERTTGRRLLYVTTLDGRLSALDIKNNGKLAWSIQTGPGALISSSIHRLELTNNGQFVRMIPSLSGGIYKFDGETIDPIPITTDNLLSSSAKFSDDLVISGGKETRTYGVSAGTGELLYECSMNGCINATDAAEETAPSNDDNDGTINSNRTGYVRKHDHMDDIIVVRRQTQTVRAVETRTGSERWNFSVGHHELNLVKSEQCHDRPFSDLDMAILDLDVKVIVPEGVICAFSKTDSSVMLWKYKFEHPIVSAWKINPSDELESIDMFGSSQWLWDQDENIFESTGSDVSPSIYLGMYEKQLYIQESVQLRKEIDDQTHLYNHMTALETHLPKIPWRPVPANGNSLMMLSQNEIIVNGNNGAGDSAFGADASEIKGNELVPYDDDSFAVSAQSVLNASEYVNGNGFFLFTKDSFNKTANEEIICESNSTVPAIEDGKVEKEKEKHGANISDQKNSPFDDLDFSLDDADAPAKVVILSLWFWWREIAVIAFTTALAVHLLIGRRQPLEPEIVVIERHIPVPTETATEAILYHNNTNHSSSQSNGGANPINALVHMHRSISESTTQSGEQYNSRFQGDFDLVRCLGRGGFGVVFEAKNKLDDCKYAVKRITLPNKKESRERVMREVKTLANCEHHNIVRYFQAWVETPPPGWQEEEDSKWLAHEMSTSIQIETPDGSTLPSSFGNGLMQSPKAKGKLQVEKKKQLLSWVSSVNSTSCSTNTGDALNEVDEDIEDEEEDSLIVFRTESQSLELREQTEENDDETSDEEQAPIEYSAQTEAIAIDIHSDSFDLKQAHMGTPNGRIDYSQLSDSFKIEFVRSTNGASSYNSDDDNENESGTTKRNSTTTKSTNSATASTAKTNSNKRQRPQSLNLNNFKEQNNNSQTDCKALLPLTNGGKLAAPPQNKVYLYIQMQLCRKESLRDWLREHKPDAREAHIASIFHQIVDAVDYVHLKGLIHRDLKPSNIFFSQDGQIKIGDFGLVTDMSDIPNMVTQCGDKSGLPSCQRHTQQVGTHLYMSPEQLRGQHYDYKVDIYSLGLIFFELLVHFGTEMERIITLRNLRDNRYPVEFPDKHPDEYSLLQLMLSKQPEVRPPTPELKLKLHDILKLTDTIGDSFNIGVVDLNGRRLSWHRNRTLSVNE